MKSSSLNTLITLLILGLLLLPAPVAEANSGPPVTDIWLTFEYEISTTLEGFQLIGCESPECEQPDLMEQYGQCDASECLDSEPVLYHVQEPECLDDTCIVNLDMYAYDVAHMKVIGQFSDGTRESDAFSAVVLNYGTVAWKVVVRDAGLSFSLDKDFEYPYGQYQNFFGNYAFTLIVELIIAALLFLVWLKFKNGDLAKGLFYVLWANIVSYPVTWFFWPALSQFEPAGNRDFGWGILVIAGLYAAFLVILSFTKEKARRVLTIIALTLLPVAVILAFVIAFAAFYGYGNSTIAVQGMPFWLTVLLAEIFAVVFETVLIYLLTPKSLELKWWQVAIISVVMNAVSYGLGSLVL